jgi:hypothetical protein
LRSASRSRRCSVLEPFAALRHTGDLDAHHGQPRPSSE